MASRSDAVVVATLALLLTVCSSRSSSTSSTTIDRAPNRLEVAMTGHGCTPVHLVARPGLSQFDLSNQTAEPASFRVLSGDHLIGQVERLGAHQDTTLALTLTPGGYLTTCEIGVKATPGELTVGSGGGSVALSQAPDLLDAATAYRLFLETHTDDLVSSLTALGAAVGRGDQAGARLAYEQARTSFGQVEPAADNFGDAEPVGLSNLAVAIDGPAQPGPGHPDAGLPLIEQGLWGTAPLSSLAPEVASVLADATQLRARVGAMHLDAIEIAGGSGDELSRSIATAVGDAAARPDSLEGVDLQAAADAAGAVITTFGPALTSRDRSLAATLTDRLARLDAAVARVATSPASDASAAVVTASDGLADALSEVAPILAQPVAR